MDAFGSSANSVLSQIHRIKTAYPELAAGGAFSGSPDEKERGLAPVLLALTGQAFAPNDITKEIQFLCAFAAHFLRELFNTVDDYKAPPSLSAKALKRFLEMQTFSLGALCFESDFLSQLWGDFAQEIERLFGQEKTNAEPRATLEMKFPDWAFSGRLHFHLAEDPQNIEQPFLFLITVATRILGKPRMQHMPLSKVVSGALHDPLMLQAVLASLKKSAESSAFMQEMLRTNRAFSPAPLSSKEAYRFLCDFSSLEKYGFIIKLPQKWQLKKPLMPSVRVKVENTNVAPQPQGKIFSLFHFNPKLTVDGEGLSDAEVATILSAPGDLVKIRGKWVLARGEDVRGVLDKWWQIAAIKHQGFTFSEALRMLSRSKMIGNKPDLDAASSEAGADSFTSEEIDLGKGFLDILESLRGETASFSPEQELHLQRHLHATLRPYQKIGVEWLVRLYQLGLGGCLADDMGLGKTLQVIGLLVAKKFGRACEKKTYNEEQKPSLLVVPASLLGNWEAELKKFAPLLQFVVLHPSRQKQYMEAEKSSCRYSRKDLLITSYAMAQRLEWLHELSFDLIIIDEAQAIKNPVAQLTRAMKKLDAHARFALTGTPVENQASDLWSIMDFCVPQVLGTLKDFQRYYAGLAEKKDFGALKDILDPILLRRLKTNKRIISDLPEKIEMKVFSGLTKIQADLYQRDLDALKNDLENCEKEIVRKGLILKSLLRFKQICNHPSQRLSDNIYDYHDSGKFLRLKNLVAQIKSRREKFIIFTQFRELTDILASFLQEITGDRGLILHGSVPVSERQNLVRLFQEDERYGFFVLSLKAGGSGLNLTRATQVIHFDRWWNPAVENQATDRCFRIGQKQRVLVHKFVCRGTIEDKIDRLIESKKNLADELVSASGETKLTEMTNESLLQLLKIDTDSTYIGEAELLDDA